MKDDKYFMRKALKVSEKSIASGNSPFAAIVVKDGKIISEGHNTVTTDFDPSCHAEMPARN